MTPPEPPKPCPFCGSTFVRVIPDGRAGPGTYVTCCECHAMGGTGVRERAIAAWNRRAEDGRE
ncbi:restriction alleviation protein, Lar family [Rhodovarius crocodyli]|uniref:Restriction alleviation protein, Lar family n=1 Tax=Rhodovarius crocodyli TaxID=1979269 RepID=A0A437MCE8_9PROT|nr:restriction alleviation protein, Lar family [Rhodovarius crocodyli]